jgi:hypothetical protein
VSYSVLYTTDSGEPWKPLPYGVYIYTHPSQQWRVPPRVVDQASAVNGYVDWLEKSEGIAFIVWLDDNGWIMIKSNIQETGYVLERPKRIGGIKRRTSIPT